MKESIDSGLLVTVTTNTEVLLKCVVCICEIKGAVPAAAHLLGSKHQKTYKKHLAREYKDNGSRVLDDAKHRDHFVAKDVSPELKSLVGEGILEEFVHNGYLHFRCTLCYCEMSGTVPTKAHIDGSLHKKKMKAALVTKGSGSNSLSTSTHCTSTYGVGSCNSPPRGSLADLESRHSTPVKPQQASPCYDCDDSSSAGGGGSLLSASIASGVLRKVTFMGAQHYECTVCGVPVSGDVPAVTHLQGKSHKKVLGRKRLQRDSLRLVPASSSSSLSSTNSATEGDSVQPDIVNATDSIGAINLNGDEGADRVTKALDAGVLAREFFGGNEFYKCNVCESASRMGGYSTAASHLLGQRHLKNIAREKATAIDSDALASGNEAFTRALRNGELCQEVGGGLRCRVCQISVTGVPSAEQHVLGGPHMQRRLKWQGNGEQSRNGTTSRLAVEVAENTLNTLLQDELEQYLLNRSRESGNAVDATTQVTSLIRRLNTEDGRSELNELHNIRIQLDGRCVQFECQSCGVTVDQDLHQLARHLLSEDHKRAASVAEDSAFHDASSSFVTASSSSSSSKARVETSPRSQDKIIRIDLNDEVDWPV